MWWTVPTTRASGEKPTQTIPHTAPCFVMLSLLWKKLRTFLYTCAPWLHILRLDTPCHLHPDLFYCLSLEQHNRLWRMLSSLRCVPCSPQWCMWWGAMGCYGQVCLVYSSSEYYNSPARIIVLMQVASPHHNPSQEVCNLLIEQALKFLDSSTIFQIEVVFTFQKFLLCTALLSTSYIENKWCNRQVEEALDKVKLTVKTLKEFKSCFQVNTKPNSNNNIYRSTRSNVPLISKKTKKWRTGTSRKILSLQDLIVL